MSRVGQAAPSTTTEQSIPASDCSHVPAAQDVHLGGHILGGPSSQPQLAMVIQAPGVALPIPSHASRVRPSNAQGRPSPHDLHYDAYVAEQAPGSLVDTCQLGNGSCMLHAEVNPFMRAADGVCKRLGIPARPAALRQFPLMGPHPAVPASCGLHAVWLSD